MAATNTKASLAPLMKRVVEEGVKDLVPNSAIIQQKVPKLTELGREYLYPVALTNEHGVTFGSADSFNYNDSIAAVYSEATIDPNPCVLRSQWGFSAADRTISKGPKAVISHLTLRTSKMKESLMKVLELTSLYGRSSVGIGVVGAVSDSSGTNVLTITDATWSPAIWGGMEGARLDAYTSTTLQNSNTYLTVSAVNFENKTVTVTGNSADTAAIDVGSYLVFRGAYGAEQYGLFYQMDTSGSVFGINNSTYNLWKGVEHAVSGNMTLGQALRGAAKAVGRGGLDEDCMLLVSPVTFEKMNEDAAALRSLDSSYSKSKIEMGANGITYHAQFGKMEVISHPFMMEGYAMLIPTKALKRIGATDLTFSLPSKEGEHIEALDSSYAFQMVCRAEWQIFLTCPAKSVLFTGITNA